MFNHEIFAVALGRALSLLRAVPADRAQQKAALRAVHSLVSLASASVRVYGGVLSIDDVGIADSLPAVGEIVRRMQAHGLAEVTIAKGAPPADLLAVLKALAADPKREGEAHDIKRGLGKAGAASIVVLPVRALDATSGRRAATVSQAFEFAAIEDAAASAPTADGPEAALFGDDLSAVARDPYGPGILDRLAALSAAIGEALPRDEVEAVARALAAVVALEPAAPEGTPRSSYVITLRRLLTREVLTGMARLAPDARLAPVVTAVLHRGGGDAVEILLELLTTAQTIRERKAFMTVLRGMPEGTDRALHMFDHADWFVLRNVAELVGELRMEEAVGPLTRLLAHADARVRRAAAVALAKVGSLATVRPLLGVLRDGAPELRALIAMGIGGAHARALAMPLVALAEAESDPDVLGEYYRALGRIGTPEAVQALAKAVQGAGGLFRRRPSAVRVAAVEGLRLAGGAAAKRALEALREDGDKAVREAALLNLELAERGPS